MNNGDISERESLASSSKTILKICGISDDDLNKRGVNGKVIESAVV